MAVTVKYFKDLFPEFKDESGTRIQIFIEQASSSLNASIWGDKLDYGTANLTAHMMSTVGSGSGSKGQVVSEKEGDLACSYNSKMSDDDPDGLSRTQYGAEYLRCRRSLLITPLVTC